MKKYITTNKHPDIKEDKEVEFDIDLDNSKYYPENEMFEYCEFDIKDHLEKGYIKKVEKKEFYPSDMVDLIHFTKCYDDTKSNQGLFNDWLKQRDK